MVQTPTGGSSKEFCTMRETVMQQRRVSDEGLRIVKLCQAGRNGLRLIPSCLDGTAEGSTG